MTVLSSFSDVLSLRWLIKNIQVEQFQRMVGIIMAFRIPIWKLQYIVNECNLPHEYTR